MRMPLHDLYAADRPREKMLLRGPHALTDAELIAVLLGSGRVGESALALATRILDGVERSLFELGKRSPQRLMAFEGVGEAKALRICTALELARRRRDAPPLQRTVVRSSLEAFEACRHEMEDLQVEQLRVLLMDRGNRIIRQQVLTSGGPSGTVADPKLVFQAALEHRATSLILVHNHPSGNIRPSEADRQVTERITTSGAMLDLPLTDHLIVGHGQYFSFADEGIL